MKVVSDPSSTLQTALYLLSNIVCTRRQHHRSICIRQAYIEEGQQTQRQEWKVCGTKTFQAYYLHELYFSYIQTQLVVL